MRMLAWIIAGVVAIGLIWSVAAMTNLVPVVDDSVSARDIAARLTRHWLTPVALTRHGQNRSEGVPPFSELGAAPLFQVHTEIFPKDALPLRGDRDGAALGDATNPTILEAMGADCCPDCASQMRPPLAPIEARPAEDARGALPAPCQQGFNVDSRLVEELDARVGYQTGIARQLRVTPRHQGICEGDAETTGKMVVARPRRPQRYVSRTDEERSLTLQAGCHLHDAFDHLRDRLRREAVVSMPALLLQAEKADRSHTRQMTACGLWRDTADLRQLRSCQRAPVHQRMEHARTCGVAH